ncbi:hypothetical protein [Nocardioides luteus]|uniref:Uncharacterized protein n=1 Tax=Nocardioides luteus TaxID=1844 RepID=A0A1J4N138_9ACTN|nr:hypothetical protein [Nocardioides luteus]OIJ25234.1 hypothetical protein UG56_018540 [Nocardioides luteus]
MHGPDILARFLTTPSEPDKYGQRWQYNSRSDRHSKVGCWGVALDLLAQSSLMQQHALSGKIVLGVNHEMRDFSTDRAKVLDLVIARPDGPVRATGMTFHTLVDHYGIDLTPDQQNLLMTLPDIRVAPVGAVLIALEAKATMTAHVKSLPRLYDELNSSHQAIHGASSQALAIAYVQINNSAEFLSSVVNSERLSEGLPPRLTIHRQPADTMRVLEKVAQMPRRSGKSGNGFDAVGVTVLEFVNDGGPVDVLTGPPAPQPGSNFHYNGMIVRMANEYDATFAHI